MAWKVSKRQTDLKKRLKTSLKIYSQASKALDRMLLKMLHHNGIYTPDDFHQQYIKRTAVGQPINSVRSSGHVKPTVSKALLDLSAALIQLKRALDYQYRNRHRHRPRS